MTISGNFDTYDDEIKAVKYYLTQMGYNPDACSVTKFGGTNERDMAVMSATDVTVKMPDNRTILFEVKQESYQRFSHYGQLGIDFISVFHFKQGKQFDRRPHGPEDFSLFMDTVNRETADFKWGKIAYSTADVWLFYVKDNSGNYCFSEGYDFAQMKNDKIGNYLSHNCQFAVNKKGRDQLSRFDTWQSAVFFVNPEQLDRYKLTREKFEQLKNIKSLFGI